MPVPTNESSVARRGACLQAANRPRPLKSLLKIRRPGKMLPGISSRISLNKTVFSLWIRMLGSSSILWDVHNVFSHLRKSGLRLLGHCYGVEVFREIRPDAHHIEAQCPRGARCVREHPGGGCLVGKG